MLNFSKNITIKVEKTPSKERKINMSKSDKPKKRSILKIVLIVFAAIIVLGIIGSLFSDDDTSTTPNTSPTTEPTTLTPAPTTEPAASPTEAPTEAPTVAPTEAPVSTYKSGMYKVGTDISAGEYIVFADNAISGYVEVSSSSSGKIEDIIANENMSYNTIITIKDGNYLTLSGAYAVPFDEVTELDTSGEGMFKVGTHIKAGEYKLECTNGISAYYEVSSNSSHNIDSIIANDNFDNNAYITVKDGQYLTISGGKIVK
jgi:hypothetical protein